MRTSIMGLLAVVACGVAASLQAANPQLPKVSNLPAGAGSNLTPSQMQQAQQIMQLRALQNRGGGSRGVQRGADPQIINNQPGIGPATTTQEQPVDSASQKTKDKRAQAKKLKAEQKKLAKEAKDAEKKAKAKNVKAEAKK